MSVVELIKNSGFPYGHKELTIGKFWTCVKCKISLKRCEEMFVFEACKSGYKLKEIM